MLKLSPQVPFWAEVLPGVRIKFAPITMPAVRAARRAAGLAFADNEEDIETAADALTAELMRRGILEWEGIGDADGNRSEVTPENVNLLLADPIGWEAVETVYIRPYGERIAEKNALSAGQNGTGLAETQAADTANSVAGGASAAKIARTSSTNRKPRKARESSI